MARLDKNPRIWHVGKLEQLFRRTGLFLWGLKGTATNEVINGFADHWRGSATRGSQIMTDGSVWRPSDNGFDDFGWLRDLRAFGGSQARSRARRLIKNWLHQYDRWVNKLTGQGFNAPDPPKNAKREYYQRIEEEQKEKNKLAYERRHGIVSS